MRAEYFIKIIQELGFSPFMGVPCSVFKYLINYMDDHKNIRNYICSSEGEAMGLAGGFALSGRIPVVYMQNDGYGNAVNPLSSLQLLYKLPALLLISWRAKPGIDDAPQHFIMGRTILELLKVFNTPYNVLKDNVDEIKIVLKNAKNHIDNTSTPYALIVGKGFFEKYQKRQIVENVKFEKRIEYIKVLAEFVEPNDVMLGATGFSGRELYQSIDFGGKFYMMGSMGCLASIGLGIAIEHPNKNVFILDGDGALLMKMGTLSTVGYYKPQNFIHICFDNNEYESTGGQKTTASMVNFTEVAKSCGYNSVMKIVDLGEFKKVIENIGNYLKPQFIHVRISSGTIGILERPTDASEEMKNRFMEYLKK